MTRRFCCGALALTVVCSGLAACGDKAQTASGRKVDGRAYDGPATAYTAGGWKAGDQAGWDAQMRTRAQGQNEYSRTGSPP